MHVLLVEDDQAFAALVELVLGHAGWTVTTTDRVAGVAELAAGADVVLTDGALLDGSAEDVLRTLGSDPSTAAIPVVVCSVRPDAVRHPAVVGRLAKPIDPTTLVSQLRASLDPAATANGPAPESEEDEYAVRQAALQELELRARHVGDAGAAMLCSQLGDELRTTARRAAHQSVGLVGALGEGELGALGSAAELLLAEGRTPDMRSGAELCRIAAELEDAARNRLLPSRRTVGPEGGPRGRGRLFVIDDDEPLNSLIRRRAARAGLEVSGATHGRQALDLLVSGRAVADVVLLDVDLPGLNGFAVLNGLATAGVLAHTNVILATVHATDVELARARSIGAVDHLSKPYDLDQLLERVLRWCPS